MHVVLIWFSFSNRAGASLKELVKTFKIRNKDYKNNICNILVVALKTKADIKFQINTDTIKNI